MATPPRTKKCGIIGVWSAQIIGYEEFGCGRVVPPPRHLTLVALGAYLSRDEFTSIFFENLLGRLGLGDFKMPLKNCTVVVDAVSG